METLIVWHYPDLKNRFFKKWVELCQLCCCIFRVECYLKACNDFALFADYMYRGFFVCLWKTTATFPLLNRWNYRFLYKVFLHFLKGGPHIYLFVWKVKRQDNLSKPLLLYGSSKICKILKPDHIMHLLYKCNKSMYYFKYS